MQQVKVRLDPNMGQVVSAICGAIGSDVSARVAKAYFSGDVEGLTAIRVDPAHYSCSIRYLLDSGCAELLRKAQFPGSANLRKRAALENFFAGEYQCLKTNQRLDPLLHNYFGSGDEHLVEFLDKARSWVEEVLGRIPSSLDPRFGPGSTYDDKVPLTTVPDKMTSRPTVYEDSRELLPILYESAWWRSLITDTRHSDPLSIRGNRFTTVPKDANKDRGICVEASCNIALQLPIGSLLKRKLEVKGIDLVYGQARHRRWVQRASLSGEHATIDLSNASDTLATSLVKLLLPPSWFDLLYCLRAPFTRLPDGKWARLEKFSSMGNGFTFELESLIFSAICFACGCGKPGVDWSVFGDDIIVPTANAKTVLAALSYFGFTQNSRKTYLEGPFRESCGADFFNGKPVRAHYVEEIPSSPEQWISLANGIRRMAEQAGGHFECSPFFPAWKVALGFIPEKIRRLRGPRELGDSVIHDDIFPTHHRVGFPGWRFVRAYLPVATSVSWKHWKPSVVMAAALYGLPSTGVIPRDSVSGYKVGYIPYS